MRKKLDTRFPAARIKKIMQADEDVGKIAMAVPLLVSKALELFLQDLCDRTYDITQKSGAKTLNSGHLKQCVQSFNVFDFLREIVSRVPDLGCHDTGGEDHPVTKRRKTAGDEENESEEDVKKNHVLELGHINSSGRRRGRGRGRPRKIDDTDSAMNEKYEDDPENIWKGNNFGEKKYEWQDDSKEKMIQIIKAQDSSLAAPVRNFDLNLDLDENGDTTTTTTTTTIIGATEVEEYYPGWYHVQKMAIINPLQLASLNTTRIEEDEDYDEEEEEG